MSTDRAELHVAAPPPPSGAPDAGSPPVRRKPWGSQPPHRELGAATSTAPRETARASLTLGLLAHSAAGLPLGLGYRLAELATILHWLGFPARRRAALANLSVMLPRGSCLDRARIAWSMMRSYNRGLIEFIRLPRVPRAGLLAGVEVVGRDHLDEGIARGRGVILTTAHLGNWELAAVIVALMGYRLHAVAGVPLTGWLHAPVRDTRARLCISTFTPADAFRRALRALERNDLVALMVDGHVFARGVTVEWFGRPTSFPPGAGLLARRTGALVVPSYCERLGRGRYRLVCETPLDPAGFATEAELHQAIATAAERQIRSHLDQWCVFRPIWTTPVSRASGAPVIVGRRAGA